MNLDIQALWSPDLGPPSVGLPTNPEDFELLFQVAVEESGRHGREVFGLTACSPSALSRVPSGKFVRATLVLAEFSWDAVRTGIEKTLLQCRSCSTWQEAIDTLRGCLDHADS